MSSKSNLRGSTAVQAAVRNAKAAAPSVARQIGPFEHADDTLRAARALANRVGMLAERLMAHYPPPTAADAPTPSAVFSTLDMSCADTDVALNLANDALDAIESALP